MPFPYATLQVHAGNKPAPDANSRPVPISQTTPHAFDADLAAPWAARDLVRVSVGLEHVDRIKVNFDRELRVAVVGVPA